MSDDLQTKLRHRWQQLPVTNSQLDIIVEQIVQRFDDLESNLEIVVGLLAERLEKLEKANDKQ